MMQSSATPSAIGPTSPMISAKMQNESERNSPRGTFMENSMADLKQIGQNNSVISHHTGMTLKSKHDLGVLRE
jgi:hypothetical protein